MDEETGFYYYGYRYYDAETSRWLNRDPIEENGGLNVFESFNNNAVNFVDSFGLALLDCARCAEDPDGPMTCQLYDDRGRRVGGPFDTNNPDRHLGAESGPRDLDGDGMIGEGEENVDYNFGLHSDGQRYGYLGPAPVGTYDISPRNNATERSRYPDGTPTINTPGFHNGTIRAGQGNNGTVNRGAVFIHGVGHSDGCLTCRQPDLDNIVEVMEESDNFRLEITEICCNDE